MDGVSVIHTMHVRCLHTCICPFDSVISDFAVENPPLGPPIESNSDFCNGQVGELLDPTERSRCYDTMDGVFVTQTLHMYWYHTCICPLDG